LPSEVDVRQHDPVFGDPEQSLVDGGPSGTPGAATSVSVLSMRSAAPSAVSSRSARTRTQLDVAGQRVDVGAAELAALQPAFLGGQLELVALPAQARTPRRMTPTRRSTPVAR
jgi:hypothetical protein